MPRPGLSATQLVHLVAAYTCGSSLKQVAVEFGCAVETARKGLLDCGVVLRPARKPTKAQKREYFPPITTGEDHD